MSLQNKKIALVYDRVNTPHGGAEKVLLALHQLFPDAPLYTSVANLNKAKWAKIFDVKTSFVQSLPFAKNNHRLLAWMMPLAFESLDLSAFDIVISVTSAEAKGIITRADQLHICYLLTPTRYLYSHKKHYQDNLTNWLFIKSFARKFLSYLRWWDQAAASRPDVLIPISKLVAARTYQYYHRKTQPVVYPPVEVISKKNNVSKPTEMQGEYYLVVSRLVSYKRIDLAIRACHQLHKKLLIVGSGPDHQKLNKLKKELQANQVHFLGNVSSKKIAELYQKCIALVLPGQEDFGVTILEALSYGKPVIIQKNSGVSELITHQTHGVLLSNETVNAVVTAITQLENSTFDRRKLIGVAKKLTTKQFQEKMYHDIVQNCNLFFQSSRLE